MVLSGTNWRNRLFRGFKLSGLAGVFVLLTGLAIWAAFERYDRLHPPPLEKLHHLSTEILDHEGALLRAFASPDGQWRLKADLSQTDKEFITLLLGYEDKRFWHHGGVDPLAMVRAAWQLASNGRIISGASTITMQLARLLEPRKKRSFSAKLRQIVRAIQLERRLSKTEILEAYLTLAPYGGNLEGVRAASLAYFAKEPRDLSLSEAALLVALPQSPERRRPDLRPDSATRARNIVLARAAKSGFLPAAEVDRAGSQPMTTTRHDLPRLAAHLSDQLRRNSPKQRVHRTLLDKDIQTKLEQVVRDAAQRLSPDLSIALVLADGRSGATLARIGSPDYVNVAHSGWVDMSQALRSPGSALKPFIYGLAFEEGLARPETLIMDRPHNFSGYRPKNFDQDYQGEVSIHRALLQSLNVPAVALLDAVGPARLMSRFRHAGLDTVLPEGGEPGLAIGLGGLGIRLTDLTQLYTAFINQGRVKALRTQPGTAQQTADLSRPGPRLLDGGAVWYVTDILRQAEAPKGATALPIAYKTGTSYGYRDAWSIGYDGRYVLGVWVGRPDNSAVPGITGRKAAAPILFEAFAKSGLKLTAFSKPPMGVSRQAREQLPPTMRRFTLASSLLEDMRLPEPSPAIVYPPEGAEIELGQTAKGLHLPLRLKIQNGRPPFRWLANGETFSANAQRRQVSWQPDGKGQSTLTVIDAAGRAASVNVFLR